MTAQKMICPKANGCRNVICKHRMPHAYNPYLGRCEALESCPPCVPVDQEEKGAKQ